MSKKIILSIVTIAIVSTLLVFVLGYHNMIFRRFIIGKGRSNDKAQSDTQQLVGTSPGILFEGNFENVEMSREKFEKGWEGLKQVPAYRWQAFAWSGAERFVSASIKTDGNRRVLYAEVNGDDPQEGGQSRFQWSLFLKERVEIIHFQYKLFLSPDIEELNEYPEVINWFSLFELWNQRATDLSSEGEYDGSARWNLSLHKDESGTLYWEWQAQYMQPLDRIYQEMYPDQQNRAAEIPLGKWFTLDIYFNRNGKTVVMVDDHKIFDFVGQNRYPERPLLYPAYEGHAANVFKLYTSEKIVNWMNARNKKIYAMYNDFKWFKF